MQNSTISRHWPTARGSHQGMVVQFGTDRADFIHSALITGDPLADNLAEEMHEVGMSHARDQFQIAARKGISAVKNPLPSLQAFFEEVENEAYYVDDHLLDKESLPYFTIPRYIHDITLTTGSLVRVYESPSIAFVLSSTGRLIDGAGRRLEETAKWFLQVMQPGSLRVGKEGYIATLNVRLLHAHMRRVARNKGFDEKEQGTAINQIDLIRTWLDFNYTPYSLSSSLGYDLTPSEIENLYSYWRYLGKLLGIDDCFISGITDHESARRINEMVQAVTGTPTDESKILTKATLTTLVQKLQVQVNMPPEEARPLVNAITRRAQGNSMSDQLEIPREPEADKELDRMIVSNRSKRDELRNDAVKWEEMMKVNLDESKKAAEASIGATAYERGASRSND